MRDRLKSEECSKYLKALADPERLRIVQCLQSGPKSVGEVAQLMRQDLANVSHHLGVMRNADVVSCRKEGKYVIYSLNEKMLSSNTASGLDVLDFGCCRIDFGRPKAANDAK